MSLFCLIKSPHHPFPFGEVCTCTRHIMSVYDWADKYTQMETLLSKTRQRSSVRQSDKEARERMSECCRIDDSDPASLPRSSRRSSQHLRSGHLSDDDDDDTAVLLAALILTLIHNVQVSLSAEWIRRITFQSASPEDHSHPRHWSSTLTNQRELTAADRPAHSHIHLREVAVTTRPT